MKIVRVESETHWRACLALRQTVFVEEQGVPVELETDDHDRSDALHFAAIEEGTIVGTVRAVPVGAGFKLGRLAVAKAARGHGIAQALIQTVLDTAAKRLASHVELDAQIQAMQLYRAFGFVAQGGIFDDAGLPHQKMVLEL